jgi:ribosomal protein L14
MVGLMAFSLLISPPESNAFLGDGGAGWANAVYLAKILAENIKHYEQLKMMIEQGKNSEQYLRLINQGIENSTGLMNSLPIKDERVLEELKSFQSAMQSVNNIYGAIPKSQEAALQMLNDQSVAESLKMVNASKEYSKSQEENALTISIQSREASPKGAARMNAEVNAQILHTLNQLLRVNGQILKLQSETLALNNKEGKDSIAGHQKLKSDMKTSLTGFKGNFNLPRF